MESLVFNKDEDYTYRGPLEVSHKTLLSILDHKDEDGYYYPRGLFYCKEPGYDDILYTAIDNQDGEAFTENFYEEDDAINWLLADDYDDDYFDAEEVRKDSIGRMTIGEHLNLFTEDNDLEIRNSTSLAAEDPDQEVTRRIINKLASISQALADEYDCDPRLVMSDMINDLRIINGDRLTDIVDQNNPWSVMTDRLAAEAKDMGLDSNIALNALLNMDERECVNLMNKILGKNRLDMRQQVNQISQTRRGMLEGLHDVLTEDKATQDRFIEKFGQKAYDDFKRLKDRLRNKNISIDLSYHIAHTDPEKMEQILYNAEHRIDDTSEEEQRVKVAENDNYEVWDIKNYKTAMKYGVDTVWCITGRYFTPYGGTEWEEHNHNPKESQAAQYFPSYLNNNYSMYLFAIPKRTDLPKYCICPSKNSEDAIVWTKDDGSFRISAEGSDRTEGTTLLQNLPKINYRGFSTEVQEWVIRNNEIIKYNGEDADIVIPDDVTSMREGCFSGNTSIKTVSIPGTITNIPNNAFSGCTSLEKVIIADGVEHVGSKAFYNCSNLKMVKLPITVAGTPSVRGLNSGAFSGCDDVKIITPKHPITFLTNEVSFYKEHIIFKVDSLDAFRSPYEGLKVLFNGKMYVYNGEEYEDNGALQEKLKRVNKLKEGYAVVNGEEGYYIVRDNKNKEFLRTTYEPEADECQRKHPGSWIEFISKSNPLFDESLMEKYNETFEYNPDDQVEYVFYELSDDDKKYANIYGLKFERQTEEGPLYSGRWEDLDNYCNDALGYELHPDYLFAVGTCPFESVDKLGEATVKDGDFYIDINRGKRESLSKDLKEANGNDLVTIHCYGQVQKMTRAEAIEKFKEAYYASEGSEQERYNNILMDLKSGETECFDDDKEYDAFHNNKVKHKITPELLKYIEDRLGRAQYNDIITDVKDGFMISVTPVLFTGSSEISPMRKIRVTNSADINITEVAQDEEDFNEAKQGVIDVVRAYAKYDGSSQLGEFLREGMKTIEYTFEKGNYPYQYDPEDAYAVIRAGMGPEEIESKLTAAGVKFDNKDLDTAIKDHLDVFEDDLYDLFFDEAKGEYDASRMDSSGMITEDLEDFPEDIQEKLNTLADLLADGLGLDRAMVMADFLGDLTTAGQENIEALLGQLREMNPQEYASQIIQHVNNNQDVRDRVDNELVGSAMLGESQETELPLADDVVSRLNNGISLHPEEFGYEDGEEAVENIGFGYSSDDPNTIYVLTGEDLEAVPFKVEELAAMLDEDGATVENGCSIELINKIWDALDGVERIDDDGIIMEDLISVDSFGSKLKK